MGMFTEHNDEIDYALHQKPLQKKIDKMEKAIKRVLASAEHSEAGTWHISSDNIALLREALDNG